MFEHEAQSPYESIGILKMVLIIYGFICILFENEGQYDFEPHAPVPDVDDSWNFCSHGSHDFNCNHL